MEPLTILHTDPLDLLFENRNKSYGAYILRKYYAQRLYISLAATICSVVLFSLACLYFQSSPMLIKEFTIPDIFIDPPPPIAPTKPMIPPPSRPSVPRPPATIQYTTPVIVASPTESKPLPPIGDIEKGAIGLKTSAGEGDPAVPGDNGASGSGTVQQNSEPGENAPEIFDHPQVMPEFPGGMDALKRFLLKNLVMPASNLESGADVWVTARFVVSADGRVRDIEVIRPGEELFNAEVKRVIAKMPDWKPGSQNHRNVAVYFSLPVHFIAGD